MSIDASDRPWRLWQVETALSCNLDCIMCPWRTVRRHGETEGIMPSSVWTALGPYLKDVESIDFSGGGEPLLQPHLMVWIQEAHDNGCRTGFLTNGILLDQKIIQQILALRVDWIAVSMDGATADVYEQIRKGAAFDRVCDNIKTLASARAGSGPKLAINFVIMDRNHHQLKDMVELASELGVDQINFKQCDVIRGVDGYGYGLFSSRESKTTRRLKKALNRAQRLAKKMRLQTTAFPFISEENPACDQDPRDSFFIRSDGYLSPCINLAYGGESVFLGKSVSVPTVHFGKLASDNLLDIWNCSDFSVFRSRFQQRVHAHDRVIVNSSFEPSLLKLQETFQAAIEAMPDPPLGCKACHYLFNTAKPYQ